MLDLSALQFISCAIIGFIALCALACYVTTWATPRNEADPEIPAKSGYLADLDTEFL